MARNRKIQVKGDPPNPASSTAESGLSPRVEAQFVPVVGVGASAGGLEAFTELLKHLPTDTGLGFVLVQHLDPQHESSLTHILSRATSMPVCQATNNLSVEANRVYVIPSNKTIAIAHGVLKLRARQPMHGPARTIDSFFESLAQDQGERAIGVILSGAATDGVHGLEAIKAEGGITLAQDDSARFASMPRSAVAAGCVDFVLKPADIATELARIAGHPYLARRVEQQRRKEARLEQPRGNVAEEPEAESYRQILSLLCRHTKVDFSLYKAATIKRRITRRMVLNQQEGLAEYASLLRDNVKELDALYADLLINVTSFFRNPEAFAVLSRKVLPKLLQQPGDGPVRVWVLGCSTGQEAYSIAMAFTEAAEQVGSARQLQVFATDLNDALLDKARQGWYNSSLVRDVSPERLGRFFIEENGGYRVKKLLRGKVVFARQNLISDPPFSRMDLVSCRNLLIYLDSELQKQVIPMLHFALKRGGFLFLGASESVDGYTELFEPRYRKHKIYFRKAAPAQLPLVSAKKDSDEKLAVARSARVGTAQWEGELSGDLIARREADRVMVNQFAPPSVLINSKLQILHFHGGTSAYLEPPTGRASFDVLKMARQELVLPLRAAIQEAKKENRTTRRENVRITQSGKTRTIDVEVIPLKNLQERCFLILFVEAQQPGRAAVPQTGRSPERLGKKETSRRIAELESELAETRDYFQSVQEQHEAANEELQSSNEEVQSANEELQSINEELETSKEELESTNEELITLNEEIINHNTEFKRNEETIIEARDYAEAIVRTVANPLLILEADLRLHKANEAFYRLSQITAKESEGCLLYELGNGQWNIPKLRELLQEVVPSARAFNAFEVSHEFEGIGRRVLLLNGRKLFIADGKPGRILLSIQDITDTMLLQQRRRLEAEIAKAVEAEQLRLGQELHDGLAQELVGIGMLMDTLALRLTTEPEVVEEIRKVRATLSTATYNTRSLAKSFFPVEIERCGLLAALQELARFAEQTWRVSCVVQSEANAPGLATDARAVQLFRIAREAIHNAAKHAQPTLIHIHLGGRDGKWSLTVKDDGVGLPPATPHPVGMGQSIMHYRASMIGGTLSVRNHEDGGVIVSCTVPASGP